MNITSFRFQLEKQLETKLDQQNQGNTFKFPNFLEKFLNRRITDDSK